MTNRTETLTNDNTSVQWVATDGACVPNPGAGGWAWVAPDGRFASGWNPRTTNNAMELEAIRSALETFSDVPLHIASDSQYALGSIGSSRKRSPDAPNYALIARIDKLVAARTEKFTTEWVRGHNGHRMNEVADRLAVKAAEQARTSGQSGASCGTTDMTAALKGRADNHREWGNQTDVGKKLGGMSAVQVGKVLTAMGWKSGKLATKAAIQAGAAHNQETKYGLTAAWNVPRVVRAMKDFLETGEIPAAA